MTLFDKNALPVTLLSFLLLLGAGQWTIKYVKGELLFGSLLLEALIA